MSDERGSETRATADSGAEVEELRRRLAEARETIDVLVSGEVDAVASEEAGSPLLTARAQRDLARRQHRLDTLLRHSADMITLAGSDGKLLYASPTSREILGEEPDALLGENLFDRVHPEDLADARGSFEELLETPGRRADVELRIRHRDGSWRRVEIRAQNLLDDTEIGAIVSDVRDVTERWEAEARERRLLEVVETAADFVGLCDTELRVIFVNRAGLRMLGFDEEADLEGDPIAKFHPEEIGRTIREKWIPGARREGIWRGESALVHRDGTRIPVSQLIQVHRGRDGEVEFYSTICRDIRDLKATEAALRERVKELRTLYRVNRELARVDLSLEDRLRRVVDAIPPGWLHPEITESRLVYRGKELATEGFTETPWMQSAQIRAVERPGGTEGVIGRIDVALLEERPMRDEGPFLAEERDLLESLARSVGETVERDRLERQFIQSQKMEAVGRLAGGVAHDFNNLLTAILGYEELAATSLGETHPIQDDLEEIRKAGEKARRLTQQLLAFGRKEIFEPEILDLATLVRELETMLARLIGEDVVVETLLAEEPALVEADATQLEQVIVNLVINARDAMPGGGRLTLEVRNLEEEAGEAGISGGSDRWVLLRVADTGTGIEPEIEAHIFEPFFTTKEEGAGTGLGLSTVHGAVRQSGGRIEVDSEPGSGTEFRILLPRVRPGSDSEEREADGALDSSPE
ncbi:MAG: PAS domain S-box protein, partial [Thermoanaerobaculia bacterium]|nr:PAS domain S-box protein [Thermoanaerobaculia bacterium]